MQETLNFTSAAHECSISIAFVIWYVGSSYRREPRAAEALKGLTEAESLASGVEIAEAAKNRFDSKVKSRAKVLT